MKKYFFLFLFVINSPYLIAQNHTRASSLRSDTIDITHIDIHIDSLNYTTKSIYAIAEIHCTSKLANVQHIFLDLDSLIVDSVWVNNTSNTFTYNQNTIDLTLPNPMNIGDSTTLKIYYHGMPHTDAQWGGFYFNGNYAFNMGVGFYAQPHVYGRAWFPCFDNFNERSSYEFYIRTTPDKMAVCNGTLADSSSNATSILWHWVLHQEIPSYLACMAVSNYVLVHQNLAGLNGTVPVSIACVATDTTKVQGSFAHLPQSFAMLENHFGAYSWPKVGYSLVPFGAGAMEHATNISIGAGFINGNLQYETLIAHELSHHWFGDLATCASAQDMWLNEGFASYCEMLHTEYVYGADAYKTAYRLNHFNVLNGAHIADNGYRAVANMDSNYTYGTTVYNKGADMLHTLRTYLGDTLFFDGLKNYVKTHKFTTVTTNILQNSLSASSGQNTNYFFADWINQAGFANFTLDSSLTNFDGTNYTLSIFIRQRKHKNQHYATHVPLPISIYQYDFTHQNYTVEINGQCEIFTITLPKRPVFVCIDEDDKISDASTFQTSIIKNIGTINYTQAKARAKINSIVNPSDSCLLRIEQHWVAPDRFTTAHGTYVLNDQRYWRVDGINLQNVQGNLIFNYNALSGNNYQDSTWLKNNEDSIKLFYRIDARSEWQEVNDSLVTGSKTDKQGNDYTRNIITGEYAFAIARNNYTDTLLTDKPTTPCVLATSIANTNTTPSFFSIYPNPNNGVFTINRNSAINENGWIHLLSVDGTILYTEKIVANEKTKKIDLNNFAKGIYFIQIQLQNNSKQMQKVIVE